MTIYKKYTIFVLSLWNSVKWITLWDNNFYQVSWRLDKKCGFLPNGQILNVGPFFWLRLYFGEAEFCEIFLLSNCEIMYAYFDLCLQLANPKTSIHQTIWFKWYSFWISRKLQWEVIWWEVPSKFKTFCFKSTSLYLNNRVAICSFFLQIKNSST